MISNFFQMPGFLKVLTAMGLCSIGFLASTLGSGGINFYGHIMTSSEWWSSGAGYAFLVVVLLASGSSILMLKRLSYGRAVHIAGWVAANLGALLAIQLNHVQSPMLLPSIGFNAAMTAVVAVYLYLSKGSRAYFSGVHS